MLALPRPYASGHESQVAFRGARRSGGESHRREARPGAVQRDANPLLNQLFILAPLDLQSVKLRLRLACARVAGAALEEWQRRGGVERQSRSLGAAKPGMFGGGPEPMPPLRKRWVTDAPTPRVGA